MNWLRINTNKLYIVNVYRVTENEINFERIFTNAQFSRKTIVYDSDYGDYYDLLVDKMLSVNLPGSAVGTEVIDVKSFVPFNEHLCNTKENLSKRKIKKLYMNSKNNDNN